MLRKKLVREKGKLKFSRYFQELKAGDTVTVVRELSVKAAFPRNIQGRIGVVEAKKGRCYVIKLKLGKDKRFIIHPVHLKKLKD
jgi:ribosomal protein L21E